MGPLDRAPRHDPEDPGRLINRAYASRIEKLKGTMRKNEVVRTKMEKATHERPNDEPRIILRGDETGPPQAGILLPTKQSSYGPVLKSPSDNGGYPKPYEPILTANGKRWERGTQWVAATDWENSYTVSNIDGMARVFRAYTQMTSAASQYTNAANIRFRLDNGTAATAATTNFYTYSTGNAVTNAEAWVDWNRHYVTCGDDFWTHDNGVAWRTAMNYAPEGAIVCEDPFGVWVREEEERKKQRAVRTWQRWNVLYEETREQLEARVARELETERQRRHDAEQRALRAEARAKLEKESRIRAELLLMEFLDEQQRTDLIEKNYFKVHTKVGNVYRIYRGAHANVYRENEEGETIENLCAQPPQLPAEDVMLAQFLALRNNEEGYRKNAGISRIDPSTRVAQDRRYPPPPHRAEQRAA